MLEKRFRDDLLLDEIRKNHDGLFVYTVPWFLFPLVSEQLLPLVSELGGVDDVSHSTLLIILRIKLSKLLCSI